MWGVGDLMTTFPCAVSLVGCRGVWGGDSVRQEQRIFLKLPDLNLPNGAMPPKRQQEGLMELNILLAAFLASFILE